MNHMYQYIVMLHIVKTFLILQHIENTIAVMQCYNNHQQNILNHDNNLMKIKTSICMYASWLLIC